MTRRCFSRNRRRGFTLPEVITAAFSMALLFSGLMLLTVNTGTGWAFGTSKMTADNSASLAMLEWAKDIRDGRSATAGVNGTSLSVTFLTANSEGDYDRNNPTTTTSVNYYLSGTNLIRQTGSTTKVLGKKIKTVLFSVAGSEVTLQITAQQQSGTKTGATTLTSQVYLRNEPPQ
jgi:type II secretory pathway component PulJ